MFAMRVIVLILCTASVANVEAVSAATHLRMQAQTALQVREEPTGTMRDTIRKVIQMLQKMASKLQEEGEAATAEYDKQICDCQKQGVQITHDINIFEDKIPSVSAEANQTGARKDELEDILKDDKDKEDDIEKDINETENKHDEDEKKYKEGELELKKNIEAIHHAVYYLRKGMAGELSLLQSPTAKVLQAVVVTAKLTDNNRDILTSFLAQDHKEEDPGTEEVIGILSQMYQEMMDDLKKMIGEEAALAWEYENLISKKEEEYEDVKEDEEDKAEELGEVSVENVYALGHLQQFNQQLTDAELKFLALKERCNKIKGAHRIYYNNLQEELRAIGDVVSMLNSDQSLETFTNLKESPGSNHMGFFLQLKASRQQIRAAEKSKRMAAVQAIHSAFPKSDIRTSFLVLAMEGSQPNLIRVVGMIDRLMNTMRNEQEDEDAAMQKCRVDLTEYGQDNATHTASHTRLTGIIAAKEADMKRIDDDIAALQKQIDDLIKERDARNEMRTDENNFYYGSIKERTEAINILKIAINRLNKHYNPDVYDTNTADTIAVSALQSEPRTPPPTEKSESAKESSKVIGILDNLIQDLTQQNMNAEADESSLYKEHQAFLTQCAKDEMKLLEYIATGNADKAQAAQDMANAMHELKDVERELEMTGKLLAQTTADCKFLTDHYEYRKEVRAQELNGLADAKTILQGGSIDTTVTAGPIDGSLDFAQMGRQTRHLRNGRVAA